MQDYTCTSLLCKHIGAKYWKSAVKAYNGAPSQPEPPRERRRIAIITRGLTRHYGRVEALRGIDLQIKQGEMFALLGPNGAGKTTLFSILSTLRRPSGGEARVLGHDVVSERARIRRAMGVVFQEPALERRLSVRDNLFLMGLFYGLSLRKARTRAGEIMETLGFADIAGRRAEDLSGGQKRRLELARSMVPRPDILFLDEATLGLDVDARRSFWVQGNSCARGTRCFSPPITWKRPRWPTASP